MLTKSTARYFAKQAYQLRLMTGREQHTAKQGTILIHREGDQIIVIDRDSDAWFAFTPAKCWSQL